MADADVYRRLVKAQDDIQALINIIALLPFAVQVEQPVPRRLLDRIPAQRRPVDLWPPQRSGVPTQRIRLPRRPR